MFTILNRLRGTNGVWSKFNGLLLSYILFSVFNNHYVALLVGILYVIGESFGWGEWVGQLSVHKKDVKGFIVINEGLNNGIAWIANKIAFSATDYTKYCRVALTIRGFYWWVCLLPLVFFIEWYSVLLAIALLSLAFPLACELGYHTSKLWNFKYMSGGSEHQEVWYGFFQDIIIIGGLIYGLN